MKKNYLNLFMSIFLLLTFISSNCQVGIGTTTPRGILDLNSPIESNLGLVLPANLSPTNIVNPQGDTVAEGTMIYDSTDKCVKYFNGTSWSECLEENSTGSALDDSSVVVECSGGFSGNFIKETALSEATYQVTITNNSFYTAKLNFQPNDLGVSGVSGIEVSSVSPTTINLEPEASQIITYSLSGTPQEHGDLTATWNNRILSCTSTVNIGEVVNESVKKLVRVAYYARFSIGSVQFPAFNSQLNNPVNYGRTGTHKGDFDGFSFTDITSTLSNLTIDQLINSYDIISIGYSHLSISDAAKVKQYVDAGGIAIIKLDNNMGTSLLNAFGGKGSVTSGRATPATLTNSHEINNGIFGNATNVQLFGFASSGRVLTSQLADDSEVLSTQGNVAQVFLTGQDNRAIFFWDEGVFRNSRVSGNIINTPQEIALHNYISYMLRKKEL